jgi:hypothetical protein
MEKLIWLNPVVLAMYDNEKLKEILKKKIII